MNKPLLEFLSFADDNNLDLRLVESRDPYLLFSNFSSINEKLLLSKTSINVNHIKIITKVITKELIILLEQPLLYLFNQFYEKDGLNYSQVLSKYSQKELLSELFIRYSELGRIFSLSIQNFINYFKEFFENYEKSKSELKNEFSNDNEIKEIIWPIGDFHNNQKCNSIILFKCGTKIVYKPKNSANFRFFTEFINFLNENNFNVEFFKLKILDYQSFYWEQFVEYKELESFQDASIYYSNLGKYLSIIYILGISDITIDNIIVNTNIPVFIDLEILLSPTRKQSKKTPFPMLNEYFSESVVCTGLLPFWTHLDIDKVMNVGGLNKEKFKYVNIFKLKVEENRLCYEILKIKENSKHLPFKNKTIFPIQNYVEQFKQSFKEVLNKFINFKPSIINFLLRNKTKDEISTRFLLRHTSVYITILNESRHPTRLISSEYSKDMLNLLHSTFDKDVFPRNLINDEIDQLLKNDIPIYSISPQSKTLLSKFNTFNDLISESGLESAIRRLTNLSQNSIEEQIKLIDKSLICFDEFNIKKQIQHSDLKEYSTAILDQNQININNIINHVIDLSEAILKKAFNYDNSFNWLEISVGRSGNWELTPKLPGVYDGLDGIGLLYLYLFKITQKKEYLTIASEISAKTLISLENVEVNESFHLLSPFSFPLSTIYFYWHLIEVSNVSDIKLKSIVNKILIPFVNINLNKDEYLDIVNGSSGLLILICDLAIKYKDNKELNKLADSIFEHLKKNAIKQNVGISWKANNFVFLIGFAHGNIGIMYSISKYYKFSKNPEALELIGLAHSYNMSKFSHIEYNWPDLRISDKTFADSSWCHGMSGIVNGYYEISDNIGYNLLDLDTNKLLEKLVEDSFILEDSVCHGNIGNAALLYNIAYKTKNLELKENILRYINFKTIENNWNISFNHQQNQGIGLFLGSAGIAFNILKMTHFDILPDILLLESPKNKGSV